MTIAKAVVRTRPWLGASRFFATDIGTAKVVRLEIGLCVFV